MEKRWFRGVMCVAVFGVTLAGCSRTDENNDPAKDMASAAADMRIASDMNAAGQDMKGEPKLDMSSEPDARQDTPDMKPADPGPCPDAPPCERGTDYDDACECVAPIDRKCSSDEDCRVGEVCTEFPREGSDKIDSICYLDPASLLVNVCPGGPECAAGEGELLAAAVSKVVTPDGYETVKPEGLDGAYMNFDPRASNVEKWNDCGYDGLCPGDPGYTEPDEGEGDKKLQGAWIAGFTNGRPAQYCPEELIGCDAPECCVSKLAHDDLKVQIAVVRKGDVTVAFAVLDAVGYFHSYIEKIREEVEAEAGVDLLIMASTHSHESPDTVGQWGGGKDAPMGHGRHAGHMKKIRQQTIDGIKEAVANLEPAQVEAAVLDVGIDGLAMSDSRPPYIFDDNIPVVRLSAKGSGAPIATMISVGNHAEVLWSGNPYISSDFFHFTREYIANGVPAVVDDQGAEVKPALEGLGGVTVMFAGAVGGLINPGSASAKDYADNVYSEHGYAKADAVGQRIAMHVLRAYRDGEIGQVASNELTVAWKKFFTPITNRIFILAGFVVELFERDIYNVRQLGPTNFVPTPPMVMSEVAIVRLGPISFFTAPGELFPESLVGGYPGRPSTYDPVIGDIEESKSTATCGPDGLPLPENDGVYPCIVKFGQENPPDFSLAPEAPYTYDRVPGEIPFFIGLGMDFLGYMVPPYDYEPDDAPGSHYEETNGASGQLHSDWEANLQLVIDAVD